MKKKNNVSWFQIGGILCIIVIPIIFIYWHWRLVDVSGAPPEKISNFIVISDNNMIYSYFSLKDENGRFTSASGNAHIMIFQDISDITEDSIKLIWDKNIQVAKKDFIRGKLGGGVTKKYAIICPLFKIRKKDISYTTKSVKCRLEFTTGEKSFQKDVKAVI